MFYGCITALVTPWLPDGTIDWGSWEALVEAQVAAPVQAIVLLGSTGEGWALETAQRQQAIQQVRRWIRNRIPLIVGTGQTSTAETCVQTRIALEAGADAVMVVTPPYNKPTPEGLYRHYQMVAQHCPIPIILYNVPGRTGVDLGRDPDIVARLADIPNIVGLKEAVGDPQRYRTWIERVGDRLDILLGEDATIFDGMAAGAKGVISVASNLLPREISALCTAMIQGEWQKAFALHEQLRPVYQALGVESNPIPIKWALYREQMIQSPMVHLPLTPLSETYHASWEAIRAYMAKIGLHPVQ